MLGVGIYDAVSGMYIIQKRSLLDECCVDWPTDSRGNELVRLVVILISSSFSVTFTLAVTAPFIIMGAMNLILASVREGKPVHNLKQVGKLAPWYEVFGPVCTDGPADGD